MTKKTLFIGAGNMATSLIGGLINAGTDPKSIFVHDINESAPLALQQRYAIQVMNAPEVDSMTSVDTLVLAVKPQNLREVCHSLAALFQRAAGSTTPLVVSIAAGIPIPAMINWLGVECAIIRAMPNTPALVNCGASGLYANNFVSQRQKQTAEAILSATGIVVWLEHESQLDIVTALSGSGPAYFFRIMESLTKSATELGLPAETARLLCLQTALGAATMASQENVDLAELRRRVTSPGGTTEQGLAVLNESNIDLLMKQVLQAAAQRSVELADQLGEQ